MEDWANKWQMKFNVDKCAVMHIGHNNIIGNYTITNQQLPVTKQQRDLGITIIKDLKWQQQTEKSCKTDNRVLGFIARNFKYRKVKKVKSSMARSLPVENLLPQNVGSIINYLQ